MNVKYDSDFDFQLAKRTGANFIYRVRQGNDFHYFDTLADAQKQFPTVDPNVNGKDFTWGYYSGIDTDSGRPVMEFCDWETERALSV